MHGLTARSRWSLFTLASASFSVCAVLAVKAKPFGCAKRAAYDRSARAPANSRPGTKPDKLVPYAATVLGCLASIPV